jgi:hypothetical protein
MALMSPATSGADVDAHSAVFDEMAAELAGLGTAGYRKRPHRRGP